MEGKITLDRATFKVLSADTRVDILKKLSERKKTLSDLAQEMGMSPSTIKEHLDKLVDAGLIEPLDRGTKWKYYVLTGKGKSIVSPTETRVWILLSSSVAALTVLAFDVYTKLTGVISSKTSIPTSLVGSKNEFGIAPKIIAEGADSMAVAADNVAKRALEVKADESAEVVMGKIRETAEPAARFAMEKSVNISKDMEVLTDQITTSTTTILESPPTTLIQRVSEKIVEQNIPNWEIFLIILASMVFLTSIYLLFFRRIKLKL